MARDIEDAREREQLPVPLTSASDAPNVALRIHPAVYLAAVVCALIFIAGAATFAAPNDSYYLIAVACGFIGFALFLPFQLWRVRRHGHDPRDSSLSHRSLRGWLAAEFEVWQSQLRGRDAAAAILLPVLAVTIGMVCFAIIIHVEIG